MKYVRNIKSVGSAINLGMLMFFSLLFFSACNQDLIYKDIRETRDGIWTYDNTLEFNPSIEDTSSVFDVYLYLEYLKSYPFQNLYFKHSYDLDGKPKTDTLSIDLIGRDGLYRGNCNEEHCTLEAPLLKRLRLSVPGSHRFVLEQFTREDSLEGIEKIGLVIRKNAY